MLSILLAAEPVASEAAAEAVPTMGLLDSFIPIAMLVAVMGLFYFISIRPQRKKEKELRKAVDAIAVGDKIVTIGGITGTVANIKEDEVTITTSIAHSMITFKKSAISTIIKRESAD
ncbi:MAG TPA: preprotein translocase subunit YajC [Clostridiaceae bacterium]|jgi:preprotein translocase subunit YajC|nr:preprotein translocase subunit YajC [Clostridiaceae bacterium]